MSDTSEGWGSQGLNLGDELFQGADRVKSFADDSGWATTPSAPSAPVSPEPASRAAGSDLAESRRRLGAARAQLLQTSEGAPVVEPAQWGARAVLRRSSGGLLRPGAGKAERAYQADLEVIRRFQWPGPFSVLVANKKGGVGKTPTCLLLAGVLAYVRTGGVVALEGADAAGTLALRAERSQESVRGISELLAEFARIRTAANLAWFTQLQSSGAAVLGSISDRTTLDESHVRALRRLLDQYYAINVVDTGNNPEASAFLQCIDGADVLVLPTVLSTGSVVSLIDTLYRVRGELPRGELLADNAVVIVTDDGRSVDAKEAARLRGALDELELGAVVDVPFDPHIAAGNEISLGRLSQASQRAWVRATAQVVTCASNLLPHLNLGRTH
ncbi:ParA family protein [Cellulomonas sp. HD19AZ1]|uniref:MinD/ParA family ATP-binding protein n=1 Tax=Cellulomonas sp. HD19AZ1 TaxID=2559593 RepID=UPI001070D472|nr:ParA family protein [Cellulomonas sp. HD19AZ1]TFH68117.1 ParA family protein [Cellulomonas sp. HD19AZ1]TFH68164.1 ParA family protein [Cellulomonas sp. HD19AZ1]